MLKPLRLILALLLAAAPHASARSRGPTPTPKSFRAGEVVAQFRASAMKSPSFSQSLSARGATVKKTLGRPGLVTLAVQGKTVEQAVRELEASGEVEFAQPNYVYRASATVPNDPQYSTLWGLKNTAQTIASAPYSTNNPGTAGQDIDVERAWDIATDCSGVTVAVVDTGVNYNHADLSANVWTTAAYPNHGYDFVDDDDDPMDLNGHGTHVAGLIGARGNNGVGTTGVCWKASIMAVRVLDSAGSGTTADIISGVNFAAAKGARVINMSLGQHSYDTALYNAINNASLSGVVFIVAAGNDGSDNETSAVYPCNFTSANLVCVAALDQAGQLTTFSNYGTTSVDVGAPGANINSLTTGTYATTDEDFSSGWTLSNWTAGTRVFSGTAYAMLLNPAGWDRSAATYSNSMDARAYRTINLTGASAATLDFYAFIDTQSGDIFSIANRPTTGDPFALGYDLDSVSGTTSGSAEYFSYDLAQCLGATCSYGFRLNTNSSGTSYGVGLVLVSVTKLTLGTASYEVLNGTSMATPITAGVAALLFSYHPSYTAADVVQAIKAGGTDNAALSGKSTTGKAVSASGSLKYIATPTGLAATVR